MQKALVIKLISALFFLFAATFSHAQTAVIQGTVKSESAREAIPFVNIGIKKKGVGTAADADGKFTLKLGDEFLADTLTFSAIGYQELSLPISAIAAGKMDEFILQQKATTLQEVHVISRKPKIRKVGTTSRNPLLWGNAESRNSNDISEFAKLIKINGKNSEVLSATLYLQSWKIDSASFRINFYENANGEPGQRIVEKSIVKRLPLDKGWKTIDLEAYGVYVDKDFFISFEYLPDSSHKEKYLFSYGAALGGGTFTRQVSLGNWKESSGATMAAYVTVRQ